MGKTALITGASSGIGYELAKCFAAGGADLVLVARDATRLNQIAGELQSTFKVSAKVITADLSRAVAPAEIYRETERASVTVDYLVCRLLLEKKKNRNHHYQYTQDQE